MKATIFRQVGRYEVHFGSQIFRAGSMRAAREFCKNNGLRVVWGV